MKKSEKLTHRMTSPSNMIALVAVVMAFGSVLLASRANRISQKQCQAAIFLDLRDRYLSLAQETRHFKERDLDFSIPDVLVQHEDEYSDFKRFWYNAFNEWALTQHFAVGETGELWRDFYYDALNDSLKYPSFRTAFQSMKKDGKFESSLERQFAQVVLKMQNMQSQ